MFTKGSSRHIALLLEVGRLRAKRTLHEFIMTPRLPIPDSCPKNTMLHFITRCVSCRSENRCRLISCNTCRWRFSGRMARGVLLQGSRFITIEIELRQANFRRWASSVRNVVEYRRSQSRWWNEVSITGWLCHEQHVRGIVALGSVQEAELIQAFERWPTTLTPLASEDVRAELYRILHPDRLATVPNRRRYQSISFSIGPRRLKSLGPCTDRAPMRPPIDIAAMPCIF